MKLDTCEITSRCQVPGQLDVSQVCRLFLPDTLISGQLRGPEKKKGILLSRESGRDIILCDTPQIRKVFVITLPKSLTEER